MSNYAGFEYPKFLWNLPKGPIAKRLETFKRAEYYPMGGYRQSEPKPNNDGIMFYLDNDLMPALRWTYCDKVENVQINHTGWFTDEYGDSDKIRGIVIRLNHGKGYLPGWTMGEGMCSELDNDIYDCPIVCAHRADRLAELVAEQERDRDVRAFNQAQQLVGTAS